MRFAVLEVCMVEVCNGWGWQWLEFAVVEVCNGWDSLWLRFALVEEAGPSVRYATVGQNKAYGY